MQRIWTCDHLITHSISFDRFYDRHYGVLNNPTLIECYAITFNQFELHSQTNSKQKSSVSGPAYSMPPVRIQIDSEAKKILCDNSVKIVCGNVNPSCPLLAGFSSSSTGALNSRDENNAPSLCSLHRIASVSSRTVTPEFDSDSWRNEEEQSRHSRYSRGALLIRFAALSHSSAPFAGSDCRRRFWKRASSETHTHSALILQVTGDFWRIWTKIQAAFAIERVNVDRIKFLGTIQLFWN